MTKHVSFLKDVDVSQTSLCGEQAAKLGELYRNNYPVPLGFVVNNSAFKDFLESNNLTGRVKQFLENTSQDYDSIMESSKELSRIIMSGQMPQTVLERVFTAYHSLETGGDLYSRVKNTALEMISAVRNKKPVVSVEPSNKFAGTFQVQKCVQGDEEVLESVKRAWTTVFSPPGIIQVKRAGGFYDCGVIVRKDVEATQSVVVFTRNPVTYADEIVVEAVWGWISPLISGEITPDVYTVNKEDYNVKGKRLAPQQWMLQKDLRTGQSVMKELSRERANSQVVPDELVKRISFWAKRVETHFGAPQKIVFKIEENRILITRVEHLPRPLSTETGGAEGFKELTSAYPSSGGVVIGRAKIINSVDDYYMISANDVAISRKALPGMEVAVMQAGGLILGAGGLSSGLSDFCRSVNKPLIIGIKDFNVFDENYDLMINAFKGAVYQREIIKPQTVHGLNYSQQFMMPTVQPLNNKVKISLEVSSDEALQSVIQFCKQLGVPVNIVKPEPVMPFLPEIPGRDASAETSYENYAPAHEEPVVPFVPEETHGTQPVREPVLPASFLEPEEPPIRQVSGKAFDFNASDDEGPTPLPQTIVENQKYEGPGEKIFQEPVKKEKPVKKEDDEDLIPYW